MGNVTVATVVALCFIFGGVAASNVQPILMLAVTAFFANLGREILKTMADYKGDLQQNCKTIDTVWGKKVAGFFVVIFFGMSATAMLLTYFSEQYSTVYLYLVVFIIYPIFAYIALNTQKNTDSQALERLILFMGKGSFVWLLALLLGAKLAV